MAIFTDVFEDVTKQGRKIPTSDYHETGVHPIIDQGQSAIAGYTDETDGLFTDVPAIIFGDHTRVLKYVDTPCFLGADGVKLLKAKIANPNYKYLYYVLSSANIPNTGYNRHFKWLKEVNIPLPNIDEQQKIVDTLDKIGELITLRKEQLVKLDQLVKSQFIELSNEWGCEAKPLQEFLDDITYGFTNPMPDAEEGPWKITAKDVVNGKINFDTARKTTLQAYEELTAKSKPNIGTVLLTKDGTLGRCAVVEEDGICVNQSVAVLKCNKKILPKFLAILLQIPEYQREMLKNAGGGTIKHIYITKVVDMLVMVPDVSQQLKFLTFVEQTDKSKLAIQQSLDKLELLKKSLMQDYFG